MSAIYQGEVIELTPQDLQTLEQELDQSDDYQTLDVLENGLDKWLNRWDFADNDFSNGDTSPLSNNSLDAYEDDSYDEMEEYLLTLESRWEEPVKPLSNNEENEWLQYENERLESAIEESENEWL